MRELIVLASLAGIYIPVIASPGPNFLVITQSAVSESRQHGIFTALGVASGSTVLACLAATGLGFMLEHIGSLHQMVQIIGGAYLLYIGFKIWRQAKQAMPTRQLEHHSRSVAQAYRYGLATNLTNPKALIFFTTIFATLVAPDAQTWVKVAGVSVIALISTVWHIVLATLFSNARVQVAYGRAKGWINRITGGLLVALGCRLLLWP